MVVCKCYVQGITNWAKQQQSSVNMGTVNIAEVTAGPGQLILSNFLSSC